VSSPSLDFSCLFFLAFFPFFFDSSSSTTSAFAALVVAAGYAGFCEIGYEITPLSIFSTSGRGDRSMLNR
jgi:hypothetical protein